LSGGPACWSASSGGLARQLASGFRAGQAPSLGFLVAPRSSGSAVAGPGGTPSALREASYRDLRREAARFDVEKPNKPVLERGHQTSYLVARWLSDAGVTSAFQVGYANGRYLFYLSRMGVACGPICRHERPNGRRWS
jgi:hypothetical protein